MFVTSCLIVPLSKERFEKAHALIKKLFVLVHETKYSETQRTLYEWTGSLLVLPRFALLSGVYEDPTLMRKLRKYLLVGQKFPPDLSALTKFPGNPWSECEEEARKRLEWSDPTFRTTETIVDRLFAGPLSQKRRTLGSMGVFVKATVGTGKTFIAFSVMRRLRCRCMFLFNNKDLAVEKYDIAKKFFRVPVGRYYEKHNENGQIIIATVQSLLARKKKPKHFVLSDFGLLAVDEAHQFAAKTFLKVFPKFRAEVTLGLSGTPRRLDCMERAVFSYLGPLEDVDPPKNKRQKFSGNYRVILYEGPPEYTKRKTNVMGGLDVSSMVTSVTADPFRQKVLEKEIKSLKKKHQTVLVLSERTSQLFDLEERGCGVVVCGKLANSERADALKRALKEGCILSTYTYFGTGRSEETITSVVYASPRRNGHVQFSGRCMRLTKNLDLLHKTRDLVDLVDVNTPLSGQYFRERRPLYKKMGFAPQEKKISYKKKGVAGEQQEETAPRKC